MLAALLLTTLIGLVIGSIAAVVTSLIASETDYSGRRKKSFYVKVWTIIPVSVILLVSLILVPLASHQTHSGIHTGYVTVVTTGGVIWSTTEVHFKTDTQSTQEDSYCVIDQALIGFLKQASDSHQRLELTLAEYFWFTDGCEFSGTVITGARAL